MSDATAGGPRVVARSPVVLGRAFAAAYAVALAGSLVVSGLTYVYVGPGVPMVQERNPVIATVIATFGREWMVWIRTAVLVACYWAYACLRSTTGWSTLAVGFAWAGAGVQLLDLAIDLRVAAAAGPPTGSSLLAAGAALVPALLAGIVLWPPADPLP